MAMSDNATEQAKEKAQQMAGQAGEKAQNVAGQAQERMREQLDQRSRQAGEKATGTAQDLRSVSEELRRQGRETPAKLADQAADRADRLGSYLRESDADRLLSDIEDFGRRQPLAVLAGGMVVGIAAARFLKASSRNRYQGRLVSDTPTRELTSPPPLEREPVGAGAPPEAPVQPSPTPGR
jgi:hypothetical protein